MAAGTAPRAALAATRRGLLLPLCLVGGLMSVGTLATALSAGPLPGSGAHVLALGTGLVGVLTWLALARPREQTSPAVAVALVVTTLAFQVTTVASEGPLLFFTQIGLALALLADVVALGAALLVPLVVVCLGAGVLLETPDDVVDSYVLLALNVAMLATAQALVSTLLATARRTDTTTRELTAVEVERQRRELARTFEGRVRRVLHDDVLAALRSVIDTPVPPGPAGEQQADGVRRECARALDALDEAAGAGPATGAAPDAGGPTPLEGVLDRLVRASPVDVDLDLDPAVAAVRVPAEVLEALEGAAGEAMRNVDRHAGVDRARLRVSPVATGLRVVVEDAGTGVPAGPDEAPGFGLTESIGSRLVEVGGAAEVGPRPGGGTRVELRWPAPAAPSSRAARRSATLRATYEGAVTHTGMLQVLGRIAYPLLAGHLVVALTYSHDAPHPVLLHLAAAAYAVWTWACVRRLRERPPTLRMGVAYAVAAPLSVLVVLPLTGPGTTEGFASWPISIATVPMVLLVFTLPRRYVALYTLPSLLVVVALVARDPEASLVGSLGALNATTTPVVISSLFGGAIRASGRRLGRERRELARTQARERSAELLEAARRRHLEHARSDVAPFMRDVATGVLPLTEEVRDRARALALETRDHLYAPGFFDEEGRRRARGFRDRGGRLDLRAGVSDELLPTAPRALLGELLASLPGHHRVTLSPPTPISAGRLSVVPSVPADDLSRWRRAFPALSWQHDDFVTTALFEVTRPDADRGPRSGGAAPPPATATQVP
ncbi:Signal transduction histidine kinase [Nocardioides scoriae]|uniref:histidine kinase n=1 Tax=Nocardioides scoriae TaxID=642780 RepID=A0A1H1UJR9_9ACTN|nr:sensor histidine kinase [Nocardioides scoriae]SDS72725.1 Signal transduction histidine kinase [Nocardioides scoriae]